MKIRITFDFTLEERIAIALRNDSESDLTRPATRSEIVGMIKTIVDTTLEDYLDTYYATLERMESE